MYKKLSVGMATALFASVVTPAVLAEEAIEDEIIVEDEEVIDEEEIIYNLTIDDAIEYGMNSSYSLLNLEYNLKKVESQLSSAEKKHRELRFDIRDLEREMDQLRKYGSATFEARYQIQEALKNMRDGLKEIEDAVEGLKTSETINDYMAEQTAQILPFQITASFLQIVMQEKQLAIQQANLEVEEQKVANIKRAYKIGTISRNEYERAMREVTRLQVKIQETEENIADEVALFALDIGIIYHDDLKLSAPNIGKTDLKIQTTDTPELIENSYSLKVAEEQLVLEEYMRERVYDDKDADEYDREQADIEVELARIELAETKKDLERAIKELYKNISSQYYSIEEAELELQFAKEDINDLKKRLDIGIISKQDYEIANKQISQAEIAIDLDLYQYYLLVKQEELLESGVILTN